MTHTIQSGSARFLVTEEDGVITAVTATGVPNPEACARNMIGQRFAAWKGRVKSRLQFAYVPKAEKERQASIRSYHKHPEDRKTEAFRKKNRESSHRFYQAHKTEICKRLREKRHAEAGT